MKDKNDSQLKLGMTIYYIPEGANNTRRIKNSIVDHIKESTISKIGRKYFYLEGVEHKFDIDTLHHSCQYHYDLQAYTDKQDIFNQLKAKELEAKISRKFDTRDINLTLEQLIAIDRIIFGED